MNQTSFNAGYSAGVAAENVVSAFDLSAYDDDYRVGYVVGRAFVESVCSASSYAAAIEAASLGQKYFISYEALAPHFNDPSDPDVLEYLRHGYQTEEDDAPYSP